MTEATATDRGARERILAAAVERIASDGIDDMRIARVAMDAGVSTSLVHYHFATREALLGEALEYSYEHAGEVRLADGSEAETDPERRLLEMVDQCLPYPGDLRQDWVLWWSCGSHRPFPSWRDCGAPVRAHAQRLRWYEAFFLPPTSTGELATARCQCDARAYGC